MYERERERERETETENVLRRPGVSLDRALLLPGIVHLSTHACCLSLSLSPSLTLYIYICICI